MIKVIKNAIGFFNLHDNTIALEDRMIKIDINSIQWFSA